MRQYSNLYNPGGGTGDTIIDARSRRTHGATDEDLAKRIRRTFSEKPFLKHIGTMVDQIGHGCFTISIQYQGHLIDEAGRFHVGVATTLMQEAGIGAASTLVAADQPLQISDFYLSSYFSSLADELKADSHVTRSRHNLMTAVVHLYGVTDVEEKLVAMGIVSVLAPGMSGEAQAKLAQIVNP